MAEVAAPGDAVVYVVDDDEAVHESIAVLIGTTGADVRAFTQPRKFLDQLEDNCATCLIADLRMPGMSGLDLQDELIAREIRWPVIMLTGFGDVPAAVRALKHGAFDFLEKPFEPERLLELVARALAHDRERREKDEITSDLMERMDALTPREAEIASRAARGDANKVIALDLDISQRTVELHRARAMKKLRVRSVAELVRIFELVAQCRGGGPSAH